MEAFPGAETFTILLDAVPVNVPPVIDTVVLSQPEPDDIVIGLSTPI